MAKQLSPAGKEMLKASCMALLGLLLVLQSFLPVLRLFGGVMLLMGLLILILVPLRQKKAEKILKDSIAAFADGSVVCREGLLIDGTLINFNTFGTRLDSLTLTDTQLVFTFSFVARGTKRTTQQAAVSVLQGERELAQKVLEAFNLPVTAPEPETAHPLDEIEDSVPRL